MTEFTGPPPSWYDPPEENAISPLDCEHREIQWETTLTGHHQYEGESLSWDRYGQCQVCGAEVWQSYYGEPCGEIELNETPPGPRQAPAAPDPDDPDIPF